MVDLVDAHGRPRVVVTGMGVKTPAGVTVESLWEAVRAGRGAAKTIERFDASELPVRFAGEVLEYDPALYFNPKEVRRVDRFTQLGFGAAADALQGGRVGNGGDRRQQQGDDQGKDGHADGIHPERTDNFGDGGERGEDGGLEGGEQEAARKSEEKGRKDARRQIHSGMTPQYMHWRVI